MSALLVFISTCCGIGNIGSFRYVSTSAMALPDHCAHITLRVSNVLRVEKIVEFVSGDNIPV